MDKNSKIYVAGHKGLVGSAIHRKLKEKGYTNFVLKTLDELDLTNQSETKRFFEKEKPEYVFLAAAKVGGIIANYNYRAEFIYDNLMIQNNIIHNSYLTGVKKLLFLGSTCIYPKEASQPMKESELLTSALEYTNEPYAIAKIAGIKTCESYNLQYGTNYIAVMPTNLYGLNDNFDLEKSHVLPAIIRKTLLGSYLENRNWEAIRKDLNQRPIEGIDGSVSEQKILEILAKYGISSNPSVSVEIWGTGTPRREFLWSDDLADACVFVMENVDFGDVAKDSVESQGVKEIRNTHINIGTGIDLTIAELANKVKEIVGFRGDFYFNKNKPDGTMQKLIDVTKIHSLGWHHKVSLDAGIKKLVDWYLRN
jgi:GDP-L-fucose synthase